MLILFRNFCHSVVAASSSGMVNCHDHRFVEHDLQWIIFVIYASAAASWRGCVYVLQRFFPSAMIVHKYETTVLGKG